VERLIQDESRDHLDFLIKNFRDPGEPSGVCVDPRRSLGALHAAASRSRSVTSPWNSANLSAKSLPLEGLFSRHGYRPTMRLKRLRPKIFQSSRASRDPEQRRALLKGVHMTLSVNLQRKRIAYAVIRFASNFAKLDPVRTFRELGFFGNQIMFFVAPHPLAKNSWRLCLFSQRDGPGRKTESSASVCSCAVPGWRLNWVQHRTIFC